MPPNTVDQFTKLTMTLKRRREEAEEVPPKKICNGLIICKEVAEDARPPSTLEDSTLLLPIEVCSIQTKKELDENFYVFSGKQLRPNFQTMSNKYESYLRLKTV